MVEFYVLPVHASQASGIDPDALDLPRSGYGVSGDALWIDPRFIEIRRQREAIARKLADHRHEIHVEISRRAAEIIKLELKRAGQVERRRERERKRLERERQTPASLKDEGRRQQHRDYMKRRRQEKPAGALSVV
jgi:hypothetical protein